MRKITDYQQWNEHESGNAHASPIFGKTREDLRSGDGERHQWRRVIPVVGRNAEQGIHDVIKDSTDTECTDRPESAGQLPPEQGHQAESGGQEREHGPRVAPPHLVEPGHEVTGAAEAPLQLLDHQRVRHRRAEHQPVEDMPRQRDQQPWAHGPGRAPAQRRTGDQHEDRQVKPGQDGKARGETERDRSALGREHDQQHQRRRNQRDLQADGGQHERIQQHQHDPDRGDPWACPGGHAPRDTGSRSRAHPQPNTAPASTYTTPSAKTGCAEPEIRVRNVTNPSSATYSGEVAVFAGWPGMSAHSPRTARFSRSPA